MVGSWEKKQGPLPPALPLLCGTDGDQSLQQTNNSVQQPTCQPGPLSHQPASSSCRLRHGRRSRPAPGPAGSPRL